MARDLIVYNFDFACNGIADDGLLQLLEQLNTPLGHRNLRVNLGTLLIKVGGDGLLLDNGWENDLNSFHIFLSKMWYSHSVFKKSNHTRKNIA